MTILAGLVFAVSMPAAEKPGNLSGTWVFDPVHSDSGGQARRSNSRVGGIPGLGGSLPGIGFPGGGYPGGGYPGGGYPGGGYPGGGYPGGGYPGGGYPGGEAVTPEAAGAPAVEVTESRRQENFPMGRCRT